MKKICLLLAMIAARAAAWSINGHLYVTAIAERLLEERCPEALVRAQDVFEALTRYNETLTTREVNHTLVESSTFADDWKYRGEAW